MTTPSQTIGQDPVEAGRFCERVIAFGSHASRREGEASSVGGMNLVARISSGSRGVAVNST